MSFPCCTFYTSRLCRFVAPVAILASKHILLHIYNKGGLGGIFLSILLREDPSDTSPMLICDRIILRLRSSSSARLLWFDALITLLHTLPTGDVGILILLLGLYRIFLLESLSTLLLLTLLRTLLLRTLLFPMLLLRERVLLLLRTLLVRTL